MRPTSAMRDRLTFSTKLTTTVNGEPVYSYTPGDTVACMVESLPGAGLFSALARLESDVKLAAHIDPHPSAVAGNRATVRGVTYAIRDVEDMLPGQMVLVLKEVVR